MHRQGMLKRLSSHAPVPRRLVRDFVNGDEDAFVAIYNRFRKPIQGFIQNQVRDEEISQDLTQEVFLKVHRFRSSYRDEFGLATWLWTIARNTCLDWRRRKSPGGADAEAGEPDEIVCPQPSAENLLAKRQNRRLLRGLLLKLTRPQRRVIWLRVIHQLSYQEISHQLGLSLSAVKCLAYRSKGALIQLATAAQGMGMTQIF